MENMSDPFASISSLCQITSSQEEILNHCRFALEPEEEEDSGPAGFPVESTGIVMVSLPETLEEKQQHGNGDENYAAQENSSNDNNHDDVFHTPPEEPSSQTLSADDIREEDRMAAEADREVWAGEGLGERIGGEICVDGRVRKRKVIHCEWASGDDDVCDFSVKRLKVSGDNLGFLTPNQRSRGERLETLGRLVKSEKSMRRRKCKDLKLGDTNGGRDNNQASFEKAMETLKSSLRKLETFYENMVTGSSKDSLGSELERGEGGLVEPAGKSSCGGSSSRSAGIETVQNGQRGETEIGMDSFRGEFVNESPSKRELNFSTNMLESDFAPSEGGGGGAVNNEIEGGEASGYVGSRRETAEKHDVVQRVLPASFELKENVEPGEVESDEVLPSRNVAMDNSGREGTEHSDVPPQRNVSEVTLLDVLRRLAKDYTYDTSLDNLSILEVAKSRGITFP